jgi:hypothetical protein
MMQAQGISRFNGELYALEAKLGHVGAAIARATGTWKAYAGTPHSAALATRRWIGALRLSVCATAIAALAALPVTIVSMLP